MPERFALYYAPPTSHPLWLKAAEWLGRDPAGGDVTPAEIGGIDTAYRISISESARRYAFHATLKAPMALAAGTTRAGLEADLVRFALNSQKVEIGRLKIANLEGFLALIPVEQSGEMTDAVGRIVLEFDHYRAPAPAGDREKRIRNGKLTPHQIEYLDRYGYPYVLDEFRFHMTLTDRLSDAERPAVMAAAEAWFGPLLEAPYTLDRIALFHEAEAGAPFTRLADFPLSAKVRADA